ncbi:MAG: HD domain-containing protein [Spirochaetales bacterium]|nr:HD domain-containing protein [Spirochaetales bacterium]
MMSNVTLKKEEKVLTISVDNLHEGMKFDAPVVFEGDNLFVAAGIPVRKKDVEKLKKFGVATVSTAGNLLSDSKQSNTQTTLKLFYMQEAEGRCLQSYNSMLKEIRDAFEKIRIGKKGFRDAIDSIVNEIFHTVKEEPNQMVQLVHGISNIAHDPAVTALHTAILATVMGLLRRMFGHELIKLTTAGLLHDVGMLRISPEILMKKGQLTINDRTVIETHPALSHGIIVKELGFSNEIGEIVLQHHERPDGTGYPQKLEQRNMTVYSQIIAVAHAYAALINKKPYRSHLLGYDAIKVILRGISLQFIPEVVELFLKCVGIYPVGSYVLLNDFSVAQVLEKSTEAPLRPIIRILVDRHGEKSKKPPIINLLKHDELYIMKAVDPEDVVI